MKIVECSEHMEVLRIQSPLGHSPHLPSLRMLRPLQPRRRPRLLRGDGKSNLFHEFVSEEIAEAVIHIYIYNNNNYGYLLLFIIVIITVLFFFDTCFLFSSLAVTS